MPPAAQNLPEMTLKDRMDSLRQLAERGDALGFGECFTALHAEVADTDHPLWQEALALARLLVPAHPVLAAMGGLEAKQASRMGDQPNSDAPEDWLQSRLEPDHTADQDRVPAPALAGEPAPPALDDAEPEDLPERSPAIGLDGLQDRDEQPLSLDFEFSATRKGARGMDEPDQSGADVPARAPGASPFEGLVDKDIDADLLVRQDAIFSLDTPLSDAVGSDQVGGEDPDWLTLNPAEDDRILDLTMDEPESGLGLGLELGVELGVALDGEGIRQDDMEVKLDLARAYLSMDDSESARALLEEIIAESDGPQRELARRLLDDLS